MNHIYLDHAATTKPDPVVLEMINKVNCKYWGNPSSFHRFGQQAKKFLDDARRIISFIVCCEPDELIFTGSGSEADNLAIKGIVGEYYHNTQYPISNNQSNFNNQNSNLEDAKKLKSYKLTPHIITSAFEHHAVLHTVEELEKQGLIEATYIKPNADGIIQVKDVEVAIRDNTILVSIMYVNNEVGTVQPIREIGKLIQKINLKRQNTRNNNQTNSNDKKSNLKNLQPTNYNLQPVSKIYFHTDAVQAVEYFEISPKYLGVDMISIAAHKFYGPKGIGALYIRKGTPFFHQIVGGGQEFGRRAGTENLAGIAGMSAALEIIFKQRADKSIENLGYPSGRAKDSSDEEYIKKTQEILKKIPALKLDQTTYKIIQLRDILIDGILKNIPDTKLNGSKDLRSPANVNISFKNAEGEAILMMLDSKGIAASSGSACTSGSLDPSHTLLSMGIPAEEAHGSVRFTLGKHTTEKEINYVLEVLPKMIKKIREMSPYN